MFEWLSKPYVSCKSAKYAIDSVVMYPAGTWLKILPQQYYRMERVPGSISFSGNGDTFVYIKLQKNLLSNDRGSELIELRAIDINEEGMFDVSNRWLYSYNINGKYHPLVGESELVDKLNCLVEEHDKQAETIRKKIENEKISVFNQKLEKAMQNTKCGDK